MIIGKIIICLIFAFCFCLGIFGLYRAFKDKYEIKMDRGIDISASIILILFGIIIGSVIL